MKLTKKLQTIICISTLLFCPTIHAETTTFVPQNEISPTIRSFYTSKWLDIFQRNYLDKIFSNIHLTINNAVNKEAESNNTYIKPYISIIETSHVGENNSEAVSTLYTYYPDTKELKKQYEFPECILGTIDLYSNSVYYSTDVPDEPDQLFTADLKTGKETALTDNSYDIHHIIPTKNQIFFTTYMAPSRNLFLASYNKTNGEITYWGNDGDTTIADISVNESTNKIYVSAYSEKQWDYNFQHQDTLGLLVPDHNIYEIDFDFKNSRVIDKQVNTVARLVLSNNDKLLTVSDKMYNSDKASMATYYDLNNNTTLPFTLPKYKLQSGGTAFSADGSGLYILSVLPSDNKRNLYFYNLENKEYTPIFKGSDNSSIDNFQFINP